MSAIQDTINDVAGSVKHWYLYMIVGALFLIVGVYMLFVPVESYVALSLLFAIMFIVAGVASVVYSISNREELSGWGWVLALGILSILMGVLMLIHPGLSMVTLAFLVGFTVLFQSASMFGYSFEMKDQGVSDWWVVMTLGVLGMIFAFILLFNPQFAGLSLVVWTAMAFMIIGFMEIYVSFKLKGVKKGFKNMTKPFTDAADDLQKGAKKLGKDISNAAQDAADDISDAAQDGAKAIKKAMKK